MTEVEAHEVVTMLITGFPRGLDKLSESQQADTRKLYRQLIVDLPFEQTKVAVRHLLSTSTFFPAIAEIRNAVVGVVHGRKRPGGDAWGDVMKAMRRHGYTRAPGTDFQFDDPLVARAVQAFGWQDLCGSDNVVADRARFIELYEGLEQNARAEAQVSPGVAMRALQIPAGTRTIGPQSLERILGGDTANSCALQEGNCKASNCPTHGSIHRS